ncbi:MAG: 50S ribosomal protein L19e [archaeon]
MKLEKVRGIAARILKGAKGKVWIDPEQVKRAEEAMTSEDVRELIKEKAIVLKKPSHQSRARARVLAEKKSKGRKSGKGKKKGSKKVRSKERKEWMLKIRALRKAMREKKGEGKLGKGYRAFYNMAKGNHFRGKKHLGLEIGKRETKASE